jgi:hypothetical protein
MKPNNKIQFDELDLKCLNEMPLILDVISSTGNKITKILSPFYSEMNELIKMNLNPNWHVGKKSYECLIFPLTSQQSIGKINIEFLETEFKIESAINIIKIVKGKEIDSIWVECGYNCSFTEEETTNGLTPY